MVLAHIFLNRYSMYCSRCFFFYCTVHVWWSMHAYRHSILFNSLIRSTKISGHQFQKYFQYYSFLNIVNDFNGPRCRLCPARLRSRWWIHNEEGSRSQAAFNSFVPSLLLAYEKPTHTEPIDCKENDEKKKWSIAHCLDGSHVNHFTRSVTALLNERSSVQKSETTWHWSNRFKEYSKTAVWLWKWRGLWLLW